MLSERFPILAPLRFIPANDTLPARYHTWPMDRGFFAEQIRDYQFKTTYEQKWSTFDRITFYFDALATSAIFTLMDEDGATLATVNLNSSNFVTVPGVTASDGSQYNSYMYRFKLSDIYALPSDIKQKIFYFGLEFLYFAPGHPSNKLWISEPQFFRRDGWAGTILFEYTNLENDYDIVFQQHNYPVMSFRVEGDIQPDEMGGHSTTFEDQGYKVSKLEEVPNRTYKCQIGGSEGVPKWVHDKVNRIIRCDKFSGEGTRFSKDQGAKWQETAATDYPLYGDTIQLQEYTPDAGTTSESEGASIVVALPTTAGAIDFPFAIPFHAIGDGMRYAIEPNPRSFLTQGALDDYIEFLNTEFVAYHDLDGHYELVLNPAVGSNWVLMYINGDGEFFVPSAVIGLTFAWHTHVAATITTMAPAATYDIYTAAWSGGTGKCIIDWGNGVVEYVNTSDVYPTLTNRTGTFADAGAYNFKLYHCGDSTDINEAINYLGLIGNANAKITAMPSAAGGHRAPAMIEIIAMNLNNFAGGVFKTEFLKYAATYLLKMLITNSNIASMENNLFGWPTGSPWILDTLSVGNNGLNTSGVNNLLSALWLNHTPPPGGIMDLRQTPDHAAAPPTGFGAALVSTYISTWGWTVLHD